MPSDSADEKDCSANAVNPFDSAAKQQFSPDDSRLFLMIQIKARVLRAPITTLGKKPAAKEHVTLEVTHPHHAMPALLILRPSCPFPKVTAYQA
ncbi:hypothetical protein J4E93_008178 [Alternaria ventricosa]|uniref:uncharacterized protein n=1 Tax=Alternaria ventricosa TaxID=1187951 RepID=UPI0020C515F6|nr:uncharacterized protein J4E93_008178 [Alternaria ventricosa]KAI4641299.1 hypothetical protein J4E93_008178 [Alternaria ventricosa]